MVTYKVKEDKVEEAKDAIGIFVDAVRDNESQTSHYIVYQMGDDDRSFTHCMTFENEEGKDLHKKAEYTKDFMDILYPICEQEPEFREIKMVKCNKHL